MRTLMPRGLVLRYSAIVIWLSRKTREFARLLGEKIKTKGKALIVWGQDPMPWKDGKSISWGKDTVLKWNRELFEKCSFKIAEVHLSGVVYRGHIDVLYKKFFGKDPTLIVVLKQVIRKKVLTETSEFVSRIEIKLPCYREPYVIKDEVYDCIYVGFKTGYIAIHFNQLI